MFYSLCCLLPGTHTFQYIWWEFSMSIRSLNTDPMSYVWIGHFSAGSDSWGVTVSLPARADSCSFPSPCSPTVEPCAASTSPECPHWCNSTAHITSPVFACVCVFSSTPQFVRLLSFPQRIGLFICGTFAPLLCLCFPASLLSARWSASPKLHCCRVMTLLYSKHLATFPHPQT